MEANHHNANSHTHNGSEVKLEPSPFPCMFTVELYDQRIPESTQLQRVYMIRPQQIWLSMERFAEIRVGNEAFQPHDTVVLSNVNRSPSRESIARILEIRAKDEDHVYLRVYYLRPAVEVAPIYTLLSQSNSIITQEQRSRELVATNELGVVDASQVEGGALVTRLSSNGRENIPPKGFWWRWMYDVATGQVS
ncbi:uncharacterized protein KY384_008407 [Bacidia gigantensis]|uniref:uncharacterized protein n=1 Tax=Bacidia gigantensis TaxID=2732470 RepID=UPI001D058E3F|nr:uncharacterized protein KY384_008407 [Bacidia gigantensis]KAG8526978.1 hypothetical protein KY384_008407 [Bacidia gigantensis]